MWFYLLCSIIIGVGMACQPAINANIAVTLESPIGATIFSVSITLLCALVLLPFFAGGHIKMSALTSLPWWSVLGGVFGVLLVAGGLAIVPITGVALFLVFFFAGQLLGAAVLDHVGAFGLTVKPMTLNRLGGIALVILGALLVNRGG